MRRLAVGFILLFHTCLSGAEILRTNGSDRFVVSQETPPWVEGEAVCVFDREEEIACGAIVKATQTAAAVVARSPKKPFATGMAVRRVPPQAKDTTAFESRHSRRRKSNVEFVIGVGGSIYFQKKAYLFPGLDVELAPWNWLSFGLAGRFHGTSGLAFAYNGYSVLFKATAHPGKLFDGPFVQLEVGKYFVTSQLGEAKASLSPLVLGLLVGYRFNASSDRDTPYLLSLALGAQRFAEGDRSSVIPLAQLLVEFAI